MSYTPKSKYQILQTSGKEWQTLDGVSYAGPYILTSGGAFIGNSIFNKGPRLQKISIKAPQQNNILENAKTDEYYRANPQVVTKIQRYKPIIATKSQPKKEDYEKGFYFRYFAKKSNTLIEYYEIDESTYKSIQNKTIKYDSNLYTVGNLVWALKGDTILPNQTSLKIQEKNFPNVSALFIDLKEYSVPYNIPQSQNSTNTLYKPPTNIQKVLKLQETIHSHQGPHPLGEDTSMKNTSTSSGGRGGY